MSLLQVVQYLPLPMSVTVSIFTVRAVTFLILLTCPSSSVIRQHIISPIHRTGYTALLKTHHKHLWWDALPCWYDPQWLNTFIFLGLLTYLKPWSHKFLHNGVKNLRNVCSGFLCYFCGLISLSSWLLLWFLIFGLMQVLFLIPVVNFSIAIVLLLPMD